MKIQSLFLSRRFWLAIGGVVFAVTSQLGLPIDEKTVGEVILVIAAWIVGDSLRKTE